MTVLERAGVGAVAALLVALPPCLTAQSLPAVRSAIQLAAEGRGDSARRVLEGALSHARAGDSTYVEILYWRARLAPAGESAARDLRRIVVEHGNSAWADDALLQLAQLATAGGNPAGALEYTARLRGDYPGSDLRARAALWGGRAAFDVGEMRTACALLDSARTEGADDVEFLNQVAFYRARCTAAALAGPMRPATAAPDARVLSVDTTPAAAASPSPTTTAAGATALPRPGATAAARGFDVQVTAARSERAAQDMVRRLARAGHRARIVQAAGDVFRVRLGPFNTSMAADSAARAAQRVVGGSPFVVRLP
jgi:cell division septation protein DedD